MKPVFHSKINNIINELRRTRVFLVVSLFLLISMKGLGQLTATISGTTTVCQGTATDITFTGAGGKHYTFTYTINGVGQLSVSTTGNNSNVKKSVPTGTAGTFTYTLVSVSDVSGSQAASGEAIVTVNPLPAITGTIPASRCGVGIVTVEATASEGTINWYDLSTGGTLLGTGPSFTMPSITGTTTYYVDATSNGCTTGSRTPVVGIVNALPIPTLTSSDADNIFCAGTSITFTAAGGTGYNFRVGGVSVQSGTTATYTTSSLTNGQVVDVIVTNANGCTATSTGITNTVNVLPATNAGTGGSECDLTFKFNAVASIGTGTWTLNTGTGTATFAPDANTATATVTVSEYGKYTFTWTEVSGTCSNSSTITVNFYLQPVANAGPDQVMEYLPGTTMDAELAHDYETGNWSLISGTGEIFDITYSKTSISGLSLDENKFLWTVTNGVCPASSDTVTIIVHDLVIPTLITPNLDGKNDYFVLRGIETLGKTELIIFDRRGAQVYKNGNYDNLWNGVDYNGNPLPDDTYFFVLKTENGKSISGYIVIRR